MTDFCPPIYLYHHLLLFPPQSDITTSYEWTRWGYTRCSTHVEMLHSVSDADEVRVVTKHTGTPPNPINTPALSAITIY